MKVSDIGISTFIYGVEHKLEPLELCCIYEAGSIYVFFKVKSPSSVSGNVAALGEVSVSQSHLLQLFGRYCKPSMAGVIVELEGHGLGLGLHFSAPIRGE
jgi:hypothetical protein